MKKSIRLRTRALARFSAPALSALSLAVAASVQAQGIEVNPVVVSASRMEQPLSEVLSSVSVITRQDIEKSQAATLADLLQGEAGFEFGRNGGPGTTTSFFLRGQNSTNVAVLIDSVRVQPDGSGSLTQTDMPLSQIERIEILRGSAGALYGDAAIGGVINIYTRKGKGQMASYGSVSYGTYNTRDVSVGYGGEVNGKSLDFNIGTTKSDGFSSMNKLQNTATNSADNGYSKNNASLRFENSVTQNLRLGVRVATTTSDNSYDKNDTNAYSFKSKNDSYTGYARAQMNDAWASTLDMTHAESKYEDFKNGSPYPADPVYHSTPSSYFNGKQNALRWGNVYQISPAYKASFGADVLKDEYDADGTYGYALHRNTKGYYGGLTSVWNALTLQANIRRDEIGLERKSASGSLSNSNIGATSTLLGAGYQLNSVWKLTGTSSTGFRAPTAYDISTNAAVKQEEFKSNEMGIVYAEANTYGRLVYFRSTTESAIGYVNSHAVNIGETKVDGVEANLRTNWRGNSIKLSAVHQNPWNVTDSKALERRANRYGSLDVSRPLGSYEVGSRLYLSGARHDTSYISYPYQPVTLSGYSTWSFYASRKIDNEWTARVKLDNAFDRQYQLAYGYNTPGRGIYATLQYQPK